MNFGVYSARREIEAGPSDCLNVHEARRFLGNCSPSTLYRLRRSGALRGLRIGWRTYIYPRGELEVFLSTRSAELQGRSSHRHHPGRSSSG